MNKMKSINMLLACFLVLAVNQLKAAIQLPAIFSNNMVLQQNFDVPFWGSASPGEQIKLKASWIKTVINVTADAKGEWLVKVKTPKAGGPYTVSVAGKSGQVNFKNVLIGEVWVCSGQSNMEMAVKGSQLEPVLNSKATIEKSANPQIRLFTVAKKISVLPQRDLEGTWQEAKPETVADFSATAYFFGRMIYDRLKIPVGLIHTSWGGTVAEAWTSNKTLQTLGDFNQRIHQLDSIGQFEQLLKQQDDAAEKVWQQHIQNPLLKLTASNFDDSSWKDAQIPGNWESTGHAGLDGIVWYRKSIDIPADWAGQDLEISLGPIDDMDNLYLNGKEVGNTLLDGRWASARFYTIPANAVKVGKNQLTLRVIDTGGDGGFTGNASQVKIYPKAKKENAMSLVGIWKMFVETKKPIKRYILSPNDPAVLYNAMIAPIIPFAIKGALWYQGESNVGRAEQYEKLFPAMITDWRNAWQQGAFPFYFVQIAPYQYGGQNISAAALRDAQRKTLSLTNTGMAVIMDVGDTTTIHPSNKQAVGERLARLALAKNYGINIAFSGPMVKSAQAKGRQVQVAFTHAEGMQFKDSGTAIFEVAGADKVFYQAKASIAGNEVIVSSDKVSAPAFVRYAYRSNAYGNLFNNAGLPASSFEISVNQ